MTGAGATGKVNGAVVAPVAGVGGTVVPEAGLLVAEAGLVEALDAEGDGEAEAEADSDGVADGDGAVTLTACPTCGYEVIGGSVAALASAVIVSELTLVDDGTCTWASTS